MTDTATTSAAIAGAVRLELFVIPRAAITPRVPAVRRRSGRAAATMRSVAAGVASASPVMMKKRALKLTPRLRVGIRRSNPPNADRPAPTSAAMGTARRARDSATDRINASLGLEAAASRAGGRAAISVAPTPSAAAFAKSIGSRETLSTDTEKYRSLMVRVTIRTSP